MSRRILVAGIGNIFLGDDGFGVEAARRLAQCPLPDGVEVVDFGIRGLDMAYALLEEYDALIFLDAAVRGEPPGTLSLIEVQAGQEGEVTIDAHGMDPVKVLALAHALGAKPTPTFVVACEPELVLDGETSEDVLVDLSEPVRGAVDEAVRMVQSLVSRLGEVTSIPDPDLRMKGGEWSWHA